MGLIGVGDMAFLSMLCCGRGTDRYVYEIIMLVFLVDKKNKLLGLCFLLLYLVWLICCWVCVCVSGFLVSWCSWYSCHDTFRFRS